MLFIFANPSHTTACDNYSTSKTEPPWGTVVQSHRNYGESSAISDVCSYHRHSACHRHPPEPSKTTVICTPKRFCFISPPSSWEGGEASCSLETKLKGSKMKGEELSSFLQWLCHQIAWCKKFLPRLNHYVYLAGSQDMEQFGDSATEATFSTCTDCTGTGTTALPYIAWVIEPPPTAGRKFFASREMLFALHIFTSMGVFRIGINSIFILVRKFLTRVAECSMMWWL